MAPGSVFADNDEYTPNLAVCRLWNLIMVADGREYCFVGCCMTGADHCNRNGCVNWGCRNIKSAELCIQFISIIEIGYENAHLRTNAVKHLTEREKKSKAHRHLQKETQDRKRSYLCT